MLRLSLATVMLSSLALLGCSGKNSTTTATLRIPAAAMPSNHIGMLYGLHVLSGKKFAKSFTQATPTISVQLPTGEWHFAMIAWDNSAGNAYEGSAKCFYKVATVAGQTQTIEAQLTTSDCAQPVFGSGAAHATDGFRPLRFHPCSRVDHVVDETGTCAYIRRGFNHSYRIALAQVDQVTGAPAQLGPLSQCFSQTPASLDNSLNTQLKLPTGSAAARFPLVLLKYDRFGCIGSPTIDVVPDGLTDSDARLYTTHATHTVIYFVDQGKDELRPLMFDVNMTGAQIPEYVSFKFTNPLRYLYFGGDDLASLLTSDLTLPYASTPVHTDGTNDVQHLTRVGNSAVMSAVSGGTGDVQDVYVFDGSTAAKLTTLGPAGAAPPYGVQSSFVVNGSTVFYEAKRDDGTDRYDVCSVDVQTAGPNHCLPTPTGTYDLRIIGYHAGKLIYARTEGTNVHLFSYVPNQGTEADLLDVGAPGLTALTPFVKNGSLFVLFYGTTSKLVQISPMGIPSVLPYAQGETTFTDMENGQHWTAFIDGTQGQVPGYIDELGAIQVLNVPSFVNATGLGYIGRLGARVLFYADQDGAGSAHNLGIYAVDGATVQLLHASTEDVNMDQDPFPVIPGGRYLFSGHTATEGHELWSTDGTPAGTAFVKDLNPGAASSNPTSKRYLNGKHIVQAVTATEGRNLFSSDGTATGTQLLGDFYPGVEDSFFYGIQATVNYFYFYAVVDGSGGRRLYRSDGTPSGTVPMFAFTSGAGVTQSQLIDGMPNYLMADASFSYHVLFRPVD